MIEFIIFLVFNVHKSCNRAHPNQIITYKHSLNSFPQNVQLLLSANGLDQIKFWTQNRNPFKKILLQNIQWLQPRFLKNEQSRAGSS